MASLPQQHAASQRRTSPTEPASPAQNHAARPNSSSTASVDSQKLLLNSPLTEDTKPAEAPQQEEAAQPTATAQAQSQPAETDNEPRRCWICFNDETEDDETTSEWRSPCPCVLVAHEKCILDWIADMEAPNPRRAAGRTAGKILCPQCKSEIRLERPRSLAVELVRTVEKGTQLLVLPSIFTALGGATYITLRYVGESTLYLVLGAQDANEILRPLYAPLDAGPVAMQLLNRCRAHWRVYLGLPVIPLMLIASRTRIADSFLPFIPLLFLASGGGEAQDNLLHLTWPPSAAFTVAALPYVRSIYNSYYDHVWLQHERRWLKEVQPRTGVVEEGNGAAHDEQDDVEAILDALAEGDTDDEGGENVEIEVDVDLLFDWQGGGPADNHNAPENPPVPIARGPAPPPEAPPIDANEIRAAEVHEHDDAAPAPNVPQRPAQQPRRLPIRRENLGTGVAGLADTVLGALIFPTIAAAMGDALKYALPSSWVTPPASGKPTGFLQTKWARSIIGGCLFVGLKDAVLLYVRWKMAQSHRHRRVLDYEGSKGKKRNT